MLHIAQVIRSPETFNKRQMICFIWKGRRPIRGILYDSYWIACCVAD